MIVRKRVRKVCELTQLRERGKTPPAVRPCCVQACVMLPVARYLTEAAVVPQPSAGKRGAVRPHQGLCLPSPSTCSLFPILAHVLSTRHLLFLFVFRHVCPVMHYNYTYLI